MTIKTKGRNRWHGATPESSENLNPTGIDPLVGWFQIETYLGGMIVRLAVWGLIPAGLAILLTQRGGLKDV